MSDRLYIYRALSHAMVGLGDDIDCIPVPEQIHDYYCVLHWLYEHPPRYVMAALVMWVNPRRPEILCTKYGAKFAGDEQNKRVLYGLQVVV